METTPTAPARTGLDLTDETLTDNRSEVLSAIAKMVLAAVDANPAIGISHHARVALTLTANPRDRDDVTDVRVEIWSDVADTDVDLNCSVDNWHGDHVETADGSTWVRYPLRVEVNYSAHGAVKPALAAERGRLIATTAELGAAIEACFGSVRVNRLLLTKAEREERAAIAELRRQERLAHDIIQPRFADELKGMKVGQSRGLNGSPHGLTGTYPTAYEVKLSSGRTYTVSPSTELSLIVTRTA